MRIIDAMRGHQAGAIDPNSPLFITLGTEEQRHARREWHRQQVAAAIMRSDRPELPRNELDFSCRHWVEHEPTGRFFLPVYGEPQYAPNFTAWYATESGDPVMLEPAAPVASRKELEERRAALEERRAGQEAQAKERRARIRAGMP